MPVAAACGQRPLSPADIAVRRREGFYRTVWPDTHYAGSVEPPPYPALLRASCLCVRDGVISHLSAARLWGLKVPPGTDLHVTVPRENWRRRDGVSCIATPLPQPTAPSATAYPSQRWRDR
ncbi:MAG TPA: hypothetical protein VEZ46_13950 [Mycobacteriales bacterium]|nr:hypothetical protein [Mycobacteriales bacterium]